MTTRRRFRRRFGAVLVAVALSGCSGSAWNQIGYGPEHRRNNDVETQITPANVDTLTEAWSVPVNGTASEVVAMPDGGLYSTVVGPDGAEVIAISPHGQKAWSLGLVDTSSTNPKPLVVGAPVVPVGDVLWASYATASGFTCESGRSQMSPSGSGADVEITPGVLGSPPAIEDDIAVRTTRSLTTVGGLCTAGPVTLTATDTKTMDVLWSATVPGNPSSPTALAASPPAIVDGQVFVANGSTLSAFPLAGCGNVTCSATWSTDVGGPIDTAPPVGGPAGQVFVAPVGGSAISARSAETGGETWRSSLSLSAEHKVWFAVLDQYVWVGNDSGPGYGPTLMVYEAAGCGAPTCSSIGGTTVFPQDLTSAPTIAAGVLYRGELGRVESFEAAKCPPPTSNCPLLGTVILPAPARALSVIDGRLIVAGDGYIKAFTSPGE